MKLKALELAYVNNRRIQVGEVIELDVKRCPKWAERLCKPTKKEEQELAEEEAEEALRLEAAIVEQARKAEIERLEARLEEKRLEDLRQQVAELDNAERSERIETKDGPDYLS